MKYVYLCGGTTSPDDPVRYHTHSLPNNALGCMDDIIRLTVPRDIDLSECDTPIREFDPVILVRFNTKLKKDETILDLWLNHGIQPHEFHKYICSDDGHSLTLDGKKQNYYMSGRFGYVTAEQCKFIFTHGSMIWQLRKLPKDLSSVRFNTPDAYPELVACARTFVENHEELAFGKTISDEVLLRKYARVYQSLRENNREVKPCPDDDSFTARAIVERLAEEFEFLELFSRP